jgi:hypothetical protein
VSFDDVTAFAGLPCNFCSLTGMQGRAKERGVEVITSIDEHGWTAARFSDKEKPSAYFMIVTDKCCCSDAGSAFL